MKILLTVAVIVLAIWLIRAARRPTGKPDEPVDAQERGKSDVAPLKMLQCAHCGVHLPGVEAVIGRSGSYCTAEHRQRAED